MSSIGVAMPLMHFITRSSYEGAWNKEVHMMDGYGTYHYPDGSEYRGRFHHGKFHGYGQLRLAQPYRFTIKGLFSQGKLVSIEDMCFADGLHVQGQFTGRVNGTDFDASNWDYLTPEDRRYQAEKRFDQPPVGPTAYVTSSLKSRLVPDHCYDVEEGFYNVKTGWLTDRPLPFTNSIYVGCRREKRWILRHCRHARTDPISEPTPYFCRQIIANNLQTELYNLSKTIIYAPDITLDRKHYYRNLCKETKKPESMTDLSSEALNCNYNPDSWATKQCIRAYERRERAESETMITLAKPRLWVSSSGIQRLDSVGPSSCSCDSFAAKSIQLDIKQAYDAANEMVNKDTTTNTLNVVQSNMIRRMSYLEMSRSRFEL